MQDHLLIWLQNWYEQENLKKDINFFISTLDNPGWRVKLDLKNTCLNGLTTTWFTEEREVDENDWFHCGLRNNLYEGFGGPFNLRHLILQLKDWIEFKEDVQKKKHSIFFESPELTKRANILDSLFRSKEVISHWLEN